MKNTLAGFLLPVVLVFPFSLKAQKKPNTLSIDPDLIIHGHSNNGFYKTPSFGGSIAASFGAGPTSSLTARIGFMHFPETSGRDQFFPIMAGYQFFPNGKNIYLQGETGFALARYFRTIDQAHFIFAAGPGYQLPVGPGFIDFSAKYNVLFFKSFSRGFAGIRVAYAFRLGG